MQSLGRAALAVGFVRSLPISAVAGSVPTGKALVALVTRLTVELGADTQKARDNATKQLIAMCKDENGKVDRKCEAYGVVMDAMKDAGKNEDPEVSERAKQVILVLAPQDKPQEPDPPPLGGVIMPEPRGKIRTPQ
jgi:hypothetical protein